MYQFFLIFPFIIIISKCTFAFSPSKTCEKPGSCDDGLPINYPFFRIIELNRSRGQCGYSDFELYCRNGKTAINVRKEYYEVAKTGTMSESFYVVNMSIPSNLEDSEYYSMSQSIDLVDLNVFDNECPQPHNKTEEIYQLFSYMWSSDDPPLGIISIFYNCSLYPAHLPHITCLEYNNSKRSYAFQGTSVSGGYNYTEGTPQGFDWHRNCEEYVLMELRRPIPGNIGDIRDQKRFRTTLQSGTRIYWRSPQYCKDCEGTGGTCVPSSVDGNRQYCKCDDKYGSSQSSSICNRGLSLKSKIIIGISAGILGVLLVLFLVYRKRLASFCKRTHYFKYMMKNPTNVDLFLESYGGLSLQRYTYSDVKRMTSSFGDTLGQGGYGTVFKGKLLDGSLVAVKVLKESKGNGEEFINEVATIGRTNHINVVRLLGFCSDGSKRALVYEFLTNGSLERFIHNDDNKEGKSLTSSLSLGWDKLYQIALGIANGLEYLHTGCNTRILHFDIKPHNILLNDDFCPKISDFGLAKICPTRETIVSMLAGRGTIGYIAPEVCCRNFGGVSYKSDVYSYGMMMLEMIGGRKNIDLNVGNTSEIYFPQWVYNHLQKDVIEEASEEVFKEETTRKMIFVALWCIQTHPKSRPSMSKVVEMLEGDIEDLELPPNPFAESSPSSSSMMQ